MLCDVFGFFGVIGYLSFRVIRECGSWLRFPRVSARFAATSPRAKSPPTPHDVHQPPVPARARPDRRRHPRRRHRRQAPAQRPRPRELGVVQGHPDGGRLSPWRFAFLGGLVASGMLDAAWDPDAQVAEPLPSMARIITAGLLVGAGTGMGNGCTSGHGICGNSRFSVRSMAYTASSWRRRTRGAATLFDTNAALGVNSAHSALNDLVTPAADVMTKYAGIVAASAAAFLARSAPRAKRSPRKTTTRVHRGARDSVSGRRGAGGPGVRRGPDRLRHAQSREGFWVLIRDRHLVRPLAHARDGRRDGGGRPRQLRRRRHKPKPACERKFSIPTNKTVDKKLITGGLLFGAGWGLAGLCPGPAIVSAAASPRRRSWRGSAPSPSACGDNTGSSSDSSAARCAARDAREGRRSQDRQVIRARRDARRETRARDDARRVGIVLFYGRY